MMALLKTIRKPAFPEQCVILPDAPAQILVIVSFFGWKNRRKSLIFLLVRGITSSWQAFEAVIKRQKHQ